jgi:SAM-dependent methyltransferase
VSVISLELDQIVSEENFDENEYLLSNPDVANAVREGAFRSGWEHWQHFGRKERRRSRAITQVSDLQHKKLAKLEPFLNLDLPHIRRGIKYDFLTDALRQETGIVSTSAVSSNDYDDYARSLIYDFPDGLVLDCGAGRRSVYYSNVVNYEIVDYDSTDVIGVGECLPFKTGSFDGVISMAVLEHVRDPFKCAAEICRVLKPGGKLLCAVPFLQPEHGYPHHYYNMAPQGLRALFDRTLIIDDHKVIDSIKPIWTLTWFLNSWAAGLQGAAREEFVSLRIGDLLNNPLELIDRSWVKQLSERKNFELACATLLFAHKPTH